MQERGPPKSVTVEDSFKSCRGFATAERVRFCAGSGLLAQPVQASCRALTHHMCAPLHALPQVVRVLAPNLLARLQEELEVSSACCCACVCACLLLPADAQLLQLAATALACRS